MPKPTQPRTEKAFARHHTSVWMPASGMTGFTTATFSAAGSCTDAFTWFIRRHTCFFLMHRFCQTPAVASVWIGALDSLALVRSELDLVKPGIDAVLLQELVVRAAFGDDALVDHIDAVGIEDRRQPVRDDERGASLGKLRK